MVLGDMMELGDYARELHYDCGNFAAEKGIDRLYCCGELSKNTLEGFQKSNKAVLSNEKRQGFHAMQRDDMAEELLRQIKEGQIRPGDILWFKASHGIHLEEIIKRIYEEC